MPALLKKKSPFCTLALFLVLILGMGNQLFSQNKPEVLSPIPGKGNLGIYQIAEDRQGFIYLVTDDGLIRYDGNEFFNLSKALNRPGKNAPGSITHLVADPKRPRFWLGAFWGLWYYDWEKNAFENIQHPAFSRWGSVSCLAFQNDSLLWFGIVQEGIFRFNTSSGEITRFHFDKCQYPACDLGKLNSLTALAFDPVRPSVIWTASLEGLCRWDLEKMEKEVFYNTSSSVPSNFLNNNHFTGLALGPSGQDILLSTYPGNVFLFQAPSGSFRKMEGVQLISEKVLRNHYLSMKPDPGGRVFIPGQWADYRYSWEDGSLVKIPEEGREFHRFSHDFTDSRGITWRGSVGELLRFDPYKQQVSSFFMESEFPQDRVERVLPGPGPNIFFAIADHTDGIKALDRSTGTWNTLKPSIPFNNQLDVLRFWDGIRTRDGSYLFLETGGLYTLSPDQNRLLPHPMQHRLNGMELRSIIEDQQGRIWIGAHLDGLICLDPNKGIFRQYREELVLPDNPNFPNYINALGVDKQGNIWLRCWKGAAVYLVKADSFRLFPDIPFLPNAFTPDAQGNLWVLGDTCVAKTDVQTGYKNLGLPHFLNMPVYYDDIRKYAIDWSGHLWSYGKTDLFRTRLSDCSTEDFTNLMGQAGQINSATLLPSGEIALGHFGGISFFDPEKIYLSREAPAPYLASLHINDRDLALDSNLLSVKRLDLSHRENYLSFRMGVKGFHLDGTLAFKVLLEGAGNSWIKRDLKNPEISFFHLRPGDYLLRIQVTNRYGVASPREYSLPIVIRPPLWLSWQAYLTYALLLSGVIFGAFRFQRQRLEMRMSLAAREEEARYLQEIDQVKSTFFTNITHELRTPLQVILGQAEQLEEKLQETQHRHTRIIRKESRRILQLVNQILELARLKAGAATFHYQQGDAAAFLRVQTESFYSAAEDQEIELRFNGPKQPLMIDFDPAKLQLILSNLLSNAVKFTPKGGQIEVVAGEEGGLLSFTVSDTGPGIAKEEQARIFESFYQIESGTTRKWEGTGMGLAIASQLAKAMGGSIAVKSSPGAGASFTVRLPITRSAPMAAPTMPGSAAEAIVIPETAPEEKSAPIAGEAPLLLIVEDNEHVREYLTTATRGRFQVVAAANGREGMEIAAALVPDIVISDVMMPEADGMELLRRLKSSEQTNHIPVLMLTAKAALEDRLKGWEAGADEYLEKPVEKAELLARLDNLLQNRRRLQEKFQRQVLLPALGPAAVENAFLKQALAIIEAEMGDEAFDIHQLAARLFLSRSQVHRKISALTGLAPSDLIRQLRLKKGRELLRSTSFSVSEVAYQCGFRTAVYFTQAFRKEFGMSPTEAREG
jgi:signal transduction histidine kinase/DNA-binding response OmpR family regulator